MSGGKGFKRLIFNMCVCDFYEYYKIHKWNIHNIRFYCSCTWENKTCCSGNYYNANKFCESELANRLYGVYESTKDKILCVEFKCKTKKVSKEKLDAIVDDTTPEVLFIDNINICHYWFVRDIFQCVLSYCGNQIWISHIRGKNYMN